MPMRLKSYLYKKEQEENLQGCKFYIFSNNIIYIFF